MLATIALAGLARAYDGNPFGGTMLPQYSDASDALANQGGSPKYMNILVGASMFSNTLFLDSYSRSNNYYLWNGHDGFVFKLALEDNRKYLSSAHELTFSVFDMKRNHYDSITETSIIDPEFYDAIMMSYTYYLGINFFKGTRLQIPVYVGVGGAYCGGSAGDDNLCDDFFFHIDFTVHAKLYITNRVALYAGYKGQKDFLYAVSANSMNTKYVDFGLVYSF